MPDSIKAEATFELSKVFSKRNIFNLRIRLDRQKLLLGPIKLSLHRYFVELNILHPLKIVDLLVSQKWRAGGQSYSYTYRFYSTYQR